MTALARHFTLWLDLVRWNRPAGWLLLLWPSLSALWIATLQRGESFPGWHLVAVFTLGTIVMRSAGCCVNDVLDRDFDRHVKRTAQRPVTSGALPVREALLVGAALALVAFALVLTTSTAAVLWSFAALGVTLFYPLSKRFFAMPQAVLGVAFSFGIPMAFAAVQGEVPALAWWLLVGNGFWVLAYDTEYAMVDRDDEDRHPHLGDHAGPLGRGRSDGVLRFLPRDVGRRRPAPRLALAVLRRLGGRRGDRRLALPLDPRTHARRLLSRLQAEPLARLRRVRRRRLRGVDRLGRCERTLHARSSRAETAIRRGKCSP